MKVHVKRWTIHFNDILDMHERKHAPYLQVAEVNHAIHHLTDAEAVTKVVERVVTVVLLNRQLERQRIIHSVTDCRILNQKHHQPCAL